MQFTYKLLYYLPKEIKRKDKEKKNENEDNFLKTR